MTRALSRSRAEHTCEAGVTLSTKANPTSFDDFTQVNTFFQLNGEGGFCIPLDFKSSNFTGLKDGQNVTVEVRNLAFWDSFSELY